MAKAMLSKTRLKEVEKVREYYIERSALFGILRWREVTKVESLGKRLLIFNDGEPIKELYINGKRWKPTK